MVSPRVNPTPCVVLIVKPENLPFLGDNSEGECSLFHNAVALVVSPPVHTAAFLLSTTLEVLSYRWDEEETLLDDPPPSLKYNEKHSFNDKWVVLASWQSLVTCYIAGASAALK